MESKEITYRVLKIIDDSGKSDYAVKKDLGFTNSVISGWRVGRAKPSTDAIIKLSKYFNISADYFLGLIDNPKPYE